jgi:hypothetical protein
MALIVTGIDGRKEKWKLLQSGIICIRKLDARDLEKSNAGFRREAQQNS